MLLAGQRLATRQHAGHKPSIQGRSLRGLKSISEDQVTAWQGGQWWTWGCQGVTAPFEHNYLDLIHYCKVNLWHTQQLSIHIHLRGHNV